MGCCTPQCPNPFVLGNEAGTIKGHATLCFWGRGTITVGLTLPDDGATGNRALTASGGVVTAREKKEPAVQAGVSGAEGFDGLRPVVVGGEAVEEGCFEAGVAGEVCYEEGVDAASYQPGDERMPEGVGGQALESG